ncbi:MAG: hypothetical protein ACI9VR_004036 [Cognaticolwellia sp.]|jgi:hypothetical protein
MKRIAIGTLVLTLATGGLAWAAGGSPMETLVNANGTSPCQDGWAGCMADGKELSHEPVTDSAGRPMPSSLRVSWFELSAGPAFSPFAPLSEYSGELPASAGGGDAVADAAPMDPERGVEPDPGTQDTATAPDPEPVGLDVDPEPIADPAPYTRPEPEPYVEPDRTRPEPGANSSARGSASSKDPEPSKGGSMGGGTSSNGGSSFGSASSNSGGNTGSGSTGSGSTGGGTSKAPDPEPLSTFGGGTSSKDPEPKDDRPDDPNSGRTVEEDRVVVEIAPEPPKVDLGCDNLVTLEPSALMGKLNDGQKSCLEDNIRNTSTITQKDKISRVLLINAEASGSKKEWERLAKRHLEDIDRSDPNLCFKYAQHLSRGGVGRAWGVIKWADYALENKSQWSGTTYKTRVYALYQLKSEAAMKLWEDANQKLVDAGADRDEWASKEEKYRGMTKDYSREWLDYARASSQDTKKPMSLCVSAAGSKKFCQD